MEKKRKGLSPIKIKKNNPRERKTQNHCQNENDNIDSLFLTYKFERL